MMKPYKLSLIATLALVWVVFGISQADAAAKASEKGAAVGGEVTVDNITITS